MRIGDIKQEAALQIAAIGVVTLFTGKPRFIKLFEGANAQGLRYSFVFDALAISGTAMMHERAKLNHTKAFSLRSGLVFFISLTSSFLIQHQGKNALLPFKSSLKLGILKIFSVACTSFLFLSIKRRNNAGIQNTHYVGNNEKITITICRTDLAKRPGFHLESLSKQLSKTWNKYNLPRLEVNFINEEGKDCGGLSRDYFNTIFGAIKNSSLFRGSIPEIENNGDALVFKHMGEAFMYFWNHNLQFPSSSAFLSSGVHFTDNIFEAALTFNAEELEGPFESFSNATKLKVASCLSPDSSDFFSKNPTDELTVGFFEKSVAAVFALAQGLKDRCVPLGAAETSGNYWDSNFKPMNPNILSVKIQGSLDREKIVGAINQLTLMRTSDHLVRKIAWMKEWIQSEASELELKQFLRFATGSSSLPPSDIPLKSISAGGCPLINSPFPDSNTCANTLYFSIVEYEVDGLHDRTKEGFIQCLKIAIARDLSYTTA